jgi:hypothetical protein
MLVLGEAASSTPQIARSVIPHSLHQELTMREPALPRCSSDELRRLAEAVDGYRETEITVYRGQGSGFATDLPGSATPGHGTPLFTAFTPRKRKGRKQVTLRQILDSVEQLGEGDAVFWSEAAVEKFVWPYYQALRIDVTELRHAWETRDDVVAILHTYPTRPVAVPAEPVRLGVLVDSDGGKSVDFQPWREERRVLQPAA